MKKLKNEIPRIFEFPTVPTRHWEIERGVAGLVASSVHHYSRVSQKGQEISTSIKKIREAILQEKKEIQKFLSKVANSEVLTIRGVIAT